MPLSAMVSVWPPGPPYADDSVLAFAAITSYRGHSPLADGVDAIADNSRRNTRA